MGAPDYTDYIMGIRQWSVNTDGYLQSTTREHVWKPSEEQTACCEGYRHYRYLLMSDEEREQHERANDGEPPHSGHHCGLYAFYNRDTCLAHGDALSTNGVRGVASAHGEIYEHEHGFRSQYMSVEAIIFEQKVATVMGSYVSLKGAHEKLAERYGVPLLEPHEVGAFMSLMGTVIEPEPVPLESEIDVHSAAMQMARLQSRAMSMSHHAPVVHTSWSHAGWSHSPEVYIGLEPSAWERFKEKIKDMFGGS